MAKLPPKPKKSKGATREELLNLDKNELIDKILQLEAHNTQLKNIISKHGNDDANNKVDANNEVENKKKSFDFTKCNFRRVLLRIMYFGWDYQGLAVQENSAQTIEHHLFQALTKSCLIEKRETSQYNRCGRTDKGVSAYGQVISISLRSKYSSEELKTSPCITGEIAYCKILNRMMPKDIKAVSWMPIPDDKPDYSARFDCFKRQYKYYFPRSNLNIESMKDACAHLVGSHDFQNLCKMDVNNGVTEFRREIFTADVIPVERDSDSPTAMYCFVIEGNAFLWHQIRCIMAVLLLIGQGQETPEIMQELLDVEKNPRKPQYNMALDLPLNLFKCSYKLEEDRRWVCDKDGMRSLIKHVQNEWTVHNIKSTMILDSLKQLENTYKSNISDDTGCENQELVAYTDCLIQGVKSKNYVNLLKRETCSSLEDRIEYYTKKRRKNEKGEYVTLNQACSSRGGRQRCKSIPGFSE